MNEYRRTILHLYGLFIGFDAYANCEYSGTCLSHLQYERMSKDSE